MNDFYVNGSGFEFNIEVIDFLELEPKIEAVYHQMIGGADRASEMSVTFDVVMTTSSVNPRGWLAKVTGRIGLNDPTMERQPNPGRTTPNRAQRRADGKRH